MVNRFLAKASGLPGRLPGDRQAYQGVCRGIVFGHPQLERGCVRLCGALRIPDPKSMPTGGYPDLLGSHSLGLAGVHPDPLRTGAALGDWKSPRLLWAPWGCSSPRPTSGRALLRPPVDNRNQ